MSDEPVTFSVIVPTTGRRSIKGMFASLADQLGPGDEVLIGWNRDGDYGNRARQSLVERARSTNLAFMDDDDQYAPGVFDAMRRFARENPGRIGIFRVRYLDGRVLWKDPELRRANVSTQMFCVPNVPGRLGCWTDPAIIDGEDLGIYYTDFGFIWATAALQGQPLFRSEVVALMRSDRRPIVRGLQRAIRPFKSAWVRLTGARTATEDAPPS